MRKKKTRPAPQMNVTPLVDVVLVLLIIFMVVIPAMNQEDDIELPSIVHADEDPKSKTDPLTLSLSRNGEIVLDKRRVPAEQVSQELAAIHRQDSTRRILLRADKDVPYGRMRALFALCHQVGFPGVSLRVHEKGDS